MITVEEIDLGTLKVSRKYNNFLIKKEGDLIVLWLDSKSNKPIARMEKAEGTLDFKLW
tara:strand:+ start:25015 stop:25188 length:174 start_codon:yes stop_codon:yes gene_type:complete